MHRSIGDSPGAGGEAGRSRRGRTQRRTSTPAPTLMYAPAASASESITVLSESALHVTVYELLAHAYNRVAIQHYHDSGTALPTGLHRTPASLFASPLPPPLQRKVIAELFADAARALATFFGFEEMNFLLLDHDEQVYRLVVREGPFFPRFQPGRYTQPFGTGILGQCHLERRTILLNDVSTSTIYVRTDPTVRAEMCVPVVLHDEVLALIDTGASRLNALSERHAAFIEGFARYLAPAMTDPAAFLQDWRPVPVSGDPMLAPLAQSLNFLYAWHEEWRSRFARLYLELARRNAELLAITDLSESLSSTLRLDTILTTTVAKVAQLLSCEMSWILLPDDDARLRIRALHGGAVSDLAQAAIAPDESASPQFAVFSRGEPIITNVFDGQLPRSSFDWAFCARHGITRFLTVPLRTRERIIGVMNVGRTRTAEDFDEKDARLLSTFANQIALYVENADLYEQSRRLGAMEERNRLARDLHDTLVQSLVGIVRTLERATSLPEPVPPALQTSLSEAVALAVQSLDEARRSVWNLHPAELSFKDLPHALRDWLELWSQRTGVAAQFRVSGAPAAMTPQVEAGVLRVGQEALSNIARHAQAAHVDVTLEFATAGLRLTVADDGAGFDPSTVETPAQARRSHRRPRAREATHHDTVLDSAASRASGGCGLRDMRERAHLMGGWLQVESAPGWGTRILLIVPSPLAGEVAGGAAATTPSHHRTPMRPMRLSASLSLQVQAQTDTPQPTALVPDADLRRISILLADDHPSVRDGLRLAFVGAAGFQVLGTAATAREALDLTGTLHPDVLLLDMQLPDDDGLAVLRSIRDAGLPTRVVMLTAHLDDAHIAAALRAGAAGYLEKEVETRLLIKAVRSAVSGRLALSPRVAGRLRQHEGMLVNVAAAHLTRREREVLESLAAGLTYRAIAQQLCVTVATVKFHAIHLYQKLHASTRVEALNHAREWGLLR